MEITVVKKKGCYFIPHAPERFICCVSTIRANVHHYYKEGIRDKGASSTNLILKKSKVAFYATFLRAGAMMGIGEF